MDDEEEKCTSLCLNEPLAGESVVKIMLAVPVDDEKINSRGPLDNIKGHLIFYSSNDLKAREQQATVKPAFC